MWGSDWPHTDTDLNRVTTYPITLRTFEDWVPTEAVRRSILVDTPSKLYGF
jgi:predicted TIM-barrel fold metal-dependent hydrolase